MATRLIQITIARSDGTDEAEISMVMPGGESGQISLSEESEEYNVFCDAVDTLWELVIGER